MKFKAPCNSDISSSFYSIMSLSLQNNISFLKYYVSLENVYVNDVNCKTRISSDMICNFKNEIMNELDNEKPLGVYKCINPNLEVHDFYENNVMNELDRILWTRFRLGNHYLKIETGRWTKIPRSDRLCDKCYSNEIQTLKHAIYECNFTRNMRIFRSMSNLCIFFNDVSNVIFLKFIDKNFY